ncbi:hypothetical protein NBT05_03170 [Aquimarina sp. ERC-38]|uniref:hypothetical protein n=1 Tax=Aquimarina sp. ERC-38 TaxID=2949996 RepID=UPI002246BDE0|nr:hypothetical protein [Aquimarina sp. ERC-38]UZO81482.1 hypothetical protein NBT05_03170 [Aquimarina sp. ERC-38]
MKKQFQQAKKNSKNVNYYLITIFLSLVAFTPLIHTFLPKKIDYKNSYSEVKLIEGKNTIGDVEIIVNNGKVTEVKEIHSQVINKVFGWSNWRRFLLGGSPFSV